MVNRLWPQVTNEREARGASYNGAGWSAFTAGVSALFAIGAMVVGHKIGSIDGGGLVDASLFALISWRIYRLLFPWAITGLALIVVELVWKITTYPRGFGIITLLIILGFINAVRGTYFLRREKKQQQTVLQAPAPAADTTSSPVVGTANL